ncbi:uncharacterized protein BYT42DRAFT_552998 [Radiomyces spectabilis]|uniref:uncharacterized protein n=1 Tax=Radiomyces spectabilis TaxID=64574 RepID=UPI00221EAF2D|nr:uncharacterized protein BYT42DRAFT_552998 [Radiomyces spectabilis]KAI8394000.1 hypothetical protein BYT42DRAFT_552998 [Radiomyces spectabilis]
MTSPFIDDTIELTSQLNDWSLHVAQSQESAELEVQRWKGYQDDYNALEKQLQTLPDETSRTAMIPIGKLAFMPGKLIHTNEITVLLGDQYYVERSAKQALGILQRRKEVVDENLRLVESKLNAIKAKSNIHLPGVLSSTEPELNEEGLPIMEIREQLPEPIVEKAPSKETVTSTDSIPKSVRRAREMMAISSKASGNDDDNKALFDMLQQLEEEEEEEKETQQHESSKDKRSPWLVQHEVGEKELEHDHDEDDEQVDWDDNLFDTELASNMFDHIQDDEEYAIQGTVDQEDLTVHDHAGLLHADAEPGDGAFITELDDEADTSEPVLQSSVKELSLETVETHPPDTKAKEKTKEGVSEAAKPVSKFKQARQQQAQREQEEQEVVNEPDNGIPTVAATRKPRMPMSRFKLARQQERKQRTMPEVTPPKDEVAKSHTPATAIPPPVSATKDEESMAEQAKPDERVIPQVKASAKKTSKFKQAREQQKKATTQLKRKVSFGAMATVHEHDTTAAPTATEGDRPAYSKPIKEDVSVEAAANPFQHKIQSPADIFRVAMLHQNMQPDGYPSLDDTVTDPTEVDLQELAKSVRSQSQELWRPSGPEAEVRLPTVPNILARAASEEEEISGKEQAVVPSNTQKGKGRMDTKTMKGMVMERETEPINLEEVEDDMDIREISSNYHLRRQQMMAAMGSFTFEPKPEFEVFDEELPLPSASKKPEVTEAPPKKMSRFKAARLGLQNKSEEEQ